MVPVNGAVTDTMDSTPHDGRPTRYQHSQMSTRPVRQPTSATARKVVPAHDQRAHRARLPVEVRAAWSDLRRCPAVARRIRRGTCGGRYVDPAFPQYHPAGAAGLL